jgi:hypothetical protein
MAPSVVVRVRDIPGTTVAIAHLDSIVRYSLDTLHDVADTSGMRTVSAFQEEPGRFSVTVTAPGFRDWETAVFVRRGWCHVATQTVTAILRAHDERIQSKKARDDAR